MSFDIPSVQGLTYSVFGIVCSAHVIIQDKSILRAAQSQYNLQSISTRLLTQILMGSTAI